MIHWASSKTSRIVTSSTEAEVHGLVHFGKENIWEREFHKVLGHFDDIKPTLVLQDNTSAISLSTKGTCHKRSKHFGLEFDVFREYVALGELKIQYVPTDDMVADLLTKPLGCQTVSKISRFDDGGRKCSKPFFRDPLVKPGLFLLSPPFFSLFPCLYISNFSV